MLSPESVQSLFAVAFGFAFAGMLATGYQLFWEKPASFRLLNSESRPKALVSVPFLVFAAPFIILRNTIRGVAIESRGFMPAMLATMLAGFWSLSCGLVMMGLMRSAGLGG
jgi:predicted phage tail protein